MNQKLSKIIVGVDLSEPSFNAINTATSLAVKTNAILYLVHAHETIFENIVSRKRLPDTPSNNISILTALASDINRKTGIRTEVVEREANAAELILRTIVEEDAGLVVLGSYGASGFRNGYTGSTAYTVAKYAPCPILIIPGGKNWDKFKKPIYPLRPVMTAMRHYPVFRRFLEKNSSLLVFGLARRNEEKDENMIRETLSMVDDDLKNDQVTISIDWSSDHDVSHNVLTMAEKNRNDILILTTAIDVSNKQFFIGPISHYIIHNARIPVLIINKVNHHHLSQVRVGREA